MLPLLITQKFKLSEVQDWYKDSVNIIDELTLESTERILDQLKDEKKQREKEKLVIN